MAGDTVAYLDGVAGGRRSWWGGATGRWWPCWRPAPPGPGGAAGADRQYDNSSGKVTGGLVDQLSAGGDQVMGFLRAEYDLSRRTPRTTSRCCRQDDASWPPNPSSISRRWRRSPPPREVMNRMGHFMTMAAVRYQRVMADRVAAIARELNRLIEGD